MKSSYSPSGPFTEKPYYTAREVEDTCTDELRKVDLLPETPQPVRIDRFIEKRFKVRITYEEVPAGVLGFTRFGPSGVEGVVISRRLAEEGTVVAERRLNTTLAHEAGHGLLHSHLFVLAHHQLGMLFGGEVDPATPKILCRDEQVGGRAPSGRRYDGRWWELQANMAIGPFLLPRTLVLAALFGILEARGALGRAVLPAAKRTEAARRLAEIFEVNPVVAQIRLEDIFPVGSDDQLTL